MSHAPLRLLLPPPPGTEQVVSADALAFVAALHQAFEPRRQALLAARRRRQAAFDAGALPDFRPETAHIREGDWKVAAIPADLLDRRVEITGPVERKMVINALNSGAATFMADFEDSNAPTWQNLLHGQRNLADAVRRAISFTGDDGRSYQLQERTATLLVRPRGWHLPEAHVRDASGAMIAGALWDFGLFFYHNAAELLRRGSGPYFYLPKLQAWEEAALWDDVFTFAQQHLGVPHGSVRATVLIETLPAAFEMHEILWALRDHAGGLNCGRWDYIFSTIKTLRAHADRLLPDRREVTMLQPAMRAYTRLVIQTCHRRGIHAMGGMAAQIPIKGDPEAHAAALARVRADKQREAGDGHDGTWVAHPGLVAVAREAFDAVLPGPHQIERPLDPTCHDAAALLAPAVGARSERGVRECVRVGVQYLTAWLGGNGCVPLDHLMEDAATAEISRAQLWQWLHHGARLDDGRTLTAALFAELCDDEVAALRADPALPRRLGPRLDEAAALFRELSLAPELADFLTLAAYPAVVAPGCWP